MDDEIEEVWNFSDSEIKEAEDSCKQFKPYRCPTCKNQTMLDRGQKFQCQMCGLEYEHMYFDSVNSESWTKWHAKIKRMLMGSIK